MNIGLGLNFAGLKQLFTGPTQAQVNQQVSSGAGSSTARSDQYKAKNEKDLRRTLGLVAAQKKVLDRAGATKAPAAKKS